MSGPLLLSTASRQIWPQIHAVLHIKPSRVLLLHSHDARESLRPAERLRDLLLGAGLPFLGGVDLKEIPDDDMHGARTAVASFVGGRRDDAIVHFTGGNKLMSTGAFLAAVDCGVRSCYLERRLQLCWFEPGDRRLATRTEKIDPHQADGIDAVALLRCQIDAVQIAGEPQAFALTGRAKALDCGTFERDLFSRTWHRDGERLQFRRGREWLEPAPDVTHKGDHLELAVVATVLRFGPSRVYKGVRIQTEGASGDQTDLDVIFNWDGHLWIVDCKDKARHWQKLNVISRYLPPRSTWEPTLQRAFGQIGSELEATHYILLKQALFDVQQGGGLQGRLVIVRRHHLPPPVGDFARAVGASHTTIEQIAPAFRELLLGTSLPPNPKNPSSSVPLTLSHQP